MKNLETEIDELEHAAVVGGALLVATIIAVVAASITLGATMASRSQDQEVENLLITQRAHGTNEYAMGWNDAMDNLKHHLDQ